MTEKNKRISKIEAANLIAWHMNQAAGSEKVRGGDWRNMPTPSQDEIMALPIEEVQELFDEL